MEPAQIEDRTDRIVRHLAIDATNEQQERLCAVVNVPCPPALQTFTWRRSGQNNCRPMCRLGAVNGPFPQRHR
jgi:hypothetical protein